MAQLIRAADYRDLDAIGVIWNRVITQTTATFTVAEKTAEDLEQWLKDRQAGRWPVLVSEVDGQVAGFATCGPFRSGEGYAHVAEHSIYVATDLTGRGLGPVLLSALERAAQRRGIAVFVAAISAENLRAQAFHVRHGFVETGRMPDMGRKSGRRIGLVLMQKHLE